MIEIGLSYDVAVIQWITPCHKNCLTILVITFWQEHITIDIDNVYVNNVFSY